MGRRRCARVSAARGIRLPSLVERDARLGDVHDCARGVVAQARLLDVRLCSPCLSSGLVPGVVPRRDERELCLRDEDVVRGAAGQPRVDGRGEVSSRAIGGAEQRLGHASDEQRAGSPVACRGELLESALRVCERAFHAVRHHVRAQIGDPGLDRDAAVRERDGRGGPIGEGEPPLGLGRPPGQRAEPGAEDGERGEPYQVGLVEPCEPPLEGLHAPAVVEGLAELVDQRGDGGRLARGLSVEDRRLRQPIGRAPGHRAGVERGHHLGLAALELASQKLAEHVVVAVPLASPVERHDEAVRAHERLERRRGLRGLERRVAEVAAHPLEH